VARTVTLVMVDAAGVPLGTLPPFDVHVPAWQDVGAVVAGARLRYGVDVDVLRLLRAQRPAPPGGPVSYVAQLCSELPERLLPVGEMPAAHPARAPWALPNGPAASVEWAVRQLAPVDVRAVQLRTWALGAIWRFDAAYTPVAWLKQVPPLAGHEAAVLELLADVAPGLAPRLLAVGPHGRMLIAHVPGPDRMDAGVELRAAVEADWHPVQERLAGCVDKLLERGVPDRRDVTARIRRLAAARADVPGLARLIEGLDARLAEVAACGLPDTLIHGDLRPGNVRGDDTHRILIDWADAAVAHPAYDILRLTGDLPADEAGELVERWARRWRTAVPGSDPARAAALLRPVAELRAAVAVTDVLGAIEPSEWPYHAEQVPQRLRAAVAAAAEA
jgi:hypothetical protein